MENIGRGKWIGRFNPAGFISGADNTEIKHNDKIDEKYLEFLMYQTGVFIRMLVVVKKDSEN